MIASARIIPSSTISDTFNRADGALGTASDGGTWTLATGTAPVILSNKLSPGAAQGCIIRDLGRTAATHTFVLNTTVGNTFNAIARIRSDGTATTNFVGLAVNGGSGQDYQLRLYKHVAGVFGQLGTSNSNVITSGVDATISIVDDGTNVTVKVNGSALTFLTSLTPGALTTNTWTGLDMPAAGFTFDTWSAG